MDVIIWFLLIFMAIFLIEVPAIDNTPTKKDILAGCARHQGVASVSNPTPFDEAVIVCRDGKVWFSK